MQIHKKVKGAIPFFGWEVVQAWVLPSLSVPATVMIGYLQDIPWFYIYVASGVMFAAVTTGLLRFSEWRSRVTVKDKLGFADIRIGLVLSDKNTIGGVKLGFRLESKASFPIQFEVNKLETHFAEHYPPKKEYEKPVVTIPPNGMGWFDDHGIQIENLDLKNKKAEGIISAHIKYGRPGRLDQELELKKKISAKFDVNGDIQAVNWQDI